MDKTKFSKRLAMLREERGLTQGELAEKVNLSRSAIGMYEQGRREADFDAVDALADFFDVGMLYMIGATDIRGRYPRDGEPEYYAEIHTVDPETLDLVEAFAKAPDETKRIVRYALGMTDPAKKRDV